MYENDLLVCMQFLKMSFFALLQPIAAKRRVLGGPHVF